MNALKVKEFGLPRWVWLVSILGIGGGLMYYRHKQITQPDDAFNGTQDDVTAADPTAMVPDTMAYNQDAGLPVGFYDAVQGAYMPSPAGPATTGAVDFGQFIAGLSALGIGRPATVPVKVVGKEGPPGPMGRPGPPGRRRRRRRRGPTGPKKHVIGGGGPPNRPLPKVQALPLLPKPITPGMGIHKKRKKKHRRKRYGAHV